MSTIIRYFEHALALPFSLRYSKCNEQGWNKREKGLSLRQCALNKLGPGLKHPSKAYNNGKEKALNQRISWLGDIFILGDQ